MGLKWRKNCTLRRDFSHYCGGIPTLRRRRRRGGRLFLPLCFFGSTPSVSHAHCEATAAGSLQGCLRPRDPKSLAHASAPRCSFPTPKARGARFTFLYSFFSRPQLTAPVRADISGRGSLLPAPPPSGAPARALLPLPFPRRRARAPSRLAPSRFPPARETPSPSASRCFLAPRSSLSTPDTAGLAPARQRWVPSFPVPFASRALRRGPSPGLLSPSLLPNSPSGRCHHVEASAATTDLPAPAAAPHATGRGPSPSRGHQPAQRRSPGVPGLHLGSPRTSCGRLPLPGACSRCRERAPPGSRGYLGASTAGTAAATSGEARGSGHRQRQVRMVGFRALEPRWPRPVHRARQTSSLATFEGHQGEWESPVKLGVGPQVLTGRRKRVPGGHQGIQGQCSVLRA